MSRIKFFLFGLVALCLSNLSFGQQATEPLQCSNPGGGIIATGTTFSVSPGYGCLDFTNNAATAVVSNPISPAAGALSNISYIFDLKNGDPLNFPPTLQTTKTFTTPGTYWILQGGNVGGTAYISCRSFEMIQTESPDITISTCGVQSVTVKFLNTPKNTKHGKYRITWGDGNQDFTAQITSWPFELQHTYAAPPTAQPQIVAIYTRTASNIGVCNSTPVPFNVGLNGKPRISELEGLNGGASDKITMIEGSDGTIYNVQQRPKGGNWVDTGKKISRNSGVVSSNITIDGLNVNNEYCFRLETKDACNNPTVSNEVCTIVPKAALLSPKAVKLDWNNPDADPTALPNVTRYGIGYSESPSGANPNTSAPAPLTALSFTFDALDCSKKYNFGITAYIGSTPLDAVIVKSPTLLVDPAKTGKLPPKNVGTVSIINKDVIRVNILETSGFAAPKYVFYRAEGGSSTYTEVKKTSDNFYDDKNVEPNKQQYCYKVEYQDECANTSELSQAFCSVFLTSTQTNTLNWTKYIIPDNDLQNSQPVKYIVDLLDANGSFVKPVGTTPDNDLGVRNTIDEVLNNANSNGQVTFRVYAIQNVSVIVDGTLRNFDLSVYSNTYTFIVPAQIFVPTAFTPNEDTNNDLFLAKGRFIDEYNLVIYDRWGNVIFETKEIDTGWNGTEVDAQTPAPPGNYGYKIYGLDTSGLKFEKIGSVTLIR